MSTNSARLLAAFLALASLAAPSAAQPPSPANCRALSLRQCSPDMCEGRPLPGGQLTDGNWLATDATAQRARVSFDQHARRVSVCWDGRCWTGVAARQWTSGNVTGVAGTMREQFQQGYPSSAAYQISFVRSTHGLLFDMIVDPSQEQSEYWVLNGSCEAPASPR